MKLWKAFSVYIGTFLIAVVLRAIFDAGRVPTVIQWIVVIPFWAAMIVLFAMVSKDLISQMRKRQLEKASLPTTLLKAYDEMREKLENEANTRLSL